MSAVQSLWLMAAIQLGAFGLIWWAVAAAGHHAAPALRRIAAFDLALAVALGLIAARGVGPELLTQAPPDVLVLWALMCLWSGLARLGGQVPRLGWVGFGVGLVGLAALVAPLLPGLAPWRAALVLATASVLVMAMTWSAGPRVLAPQAAWTRGVLWGLAALIAGLMLLRAAGGLWWGWSTFVDQDLGGVGSLVFAHVAIAVLGALNGLLAYLVLREAMTRLERTSRRDALTGVMNRRGFEEVLLQCWDRWGRERRPFALLCIDIDHFKAVNDEYGHAAGDEVLMRVSAVVSHQLRKVDQLARLGGDEFVALLDGQDGLDDLAAAGARIGQAVREMRLLPMLPSLRLSISIGATPVQLSDTTVASILRRADDALYLAKAAGRDTCRVVGAAGELEYAVQQGAQAGSADPRAF